MSADRARRRARRVGCLRTRARLFTPAPGGSRPTLVSARRALILPRHWQKGVGGIDDEDEPGVGRDDETRRQRAESNQASREKN